MNSFQSFFSLLLPFLLSNCGQPVNGQKTAAAAPPADTALTITYIANAGLLISAGPDKVLIDALHRKINPFF